MRPCNIISKASEKSMKTKPKPCDIEHIVILNICNIEHIVILNICNIYDFSHATLKTMQCDVLSQNVRSLRESLFLISFSSKPAYFLMSLTVLSSQRAYDLVNERRSRHYSYWLEYVLFCKGPLLI